MRKRVYFIRPVGMDGPVKIGCSDSPDGRRRSLEQWSPFPLEIVANIEGGFELERRLHWHLHETRMHGEWFRASEELTAIIDAIQNCVFDADTIACSKPNGYRRCNAPAYVGKQSALSRAAGRTEYYSKIVCPFEYRDAYKEGRMADVLATEKWIEKNRTWRPYQ